MNGIVQKAFCHLYDFLKKAFGKNVSSNDINGKSIRVELGVDSGAATATWMQFIENSYIRGNDFKGNLYAGYIVDVGAWVLPSWVWTNAATVRCYCKIGQVEKAKGLGNVLLKEQHDCGGWIVRNDYDKNGAVPVLAPNDSAYIANNAMIELFKATGEILYLDSARKCAEWIIETSRPDGMVYVCYNSRDQFWDKRCVIVDVGFTAGLFANLFLITNEKRYKTFLESFVDRYIELFYLPSKSGFCTSIDSADKPQGGMFGRGQAWALEGLIPAYKVLGRMEIKTVIESTIKNLIDVQCRDGGWSYNLTRPLMGEDCKAISVIAKDIMEWVPFVFDHDFKAQIILCAQKALIWCRRHTSNNGEAKGGIFSFCYEGAIVHNLNSTCAFVYASAYAIELEKMLGNE